MKAFRGCVIVAVIISCIATSYALTDDQISSFFTGSGGHTWSSASYTNNVELSSSMTITDKVWTKPKTGAKAYFHYFEFNGIPDYSDVSSYADWTSNGGNQKKISEQDYAKCIPKDPELQDADACTSVSGFVGITINGTPLWTWHTSSGTDAVSDETMDDCGGHPNADGKYHYHGWNTDDFNSIDPGCLASSHTTDFDKDACPAPLLGIALDGFPIYGPQKCDQCATNGEGTNGTCDTFSGTASGLFTSTSSELTNGGRVPDGKHDGDSDKSHAWEYRLHTDQYYHITCFRGSTAALARCTGSNASDAKKRGDENLAKMDEEEELEELEKELLENRLQLLLKSLLKRGKE